MGLVIVWMVVEDGLLISFDLCEGVIFLDGMFFDVIVVEWNLKCWMGVVDFLWIGIVDVYDSIVIDVLNKIMVKLKWVVLVVFLELIIVCFVWFLLFKVVVG